eukprot:TRINITY_DN11635_c0_g1_i1.p1 TRINITY_DN11635_c0_g1~~TRINITY_DN11635_c0_g1_i1.p1  ORF type:complete len:322 (-),score=75.24 TRINITY_DN11635_c0_g1_i1:160-1125(-)
MVIGRAVEGGTTALVLSHLLRGAYRLLPPSPIPTSQFVGTTDRFEAPIPIWSAKLCKNDDNDDDGDEEKQKQDDSEKDDDREKLFGYSKDMMLRVGIPKPTIIDDSCGDVWTQKHQDMLGKVQETNWDGITQNEIMELFPVDAKRVMEELMGWGLVVRVYGYDTARFVAQEFVQPWTYQPVDSIDDVANAMMSSLEEPNEAADAANVPSKDSPRDVVAVWKNVDGSINTDVLGKLKAKVFEIVSTSPGATAAVIHRDLEGMLHLSELRDVLEMMLEQEWLYCESVQAERAGLFASPSASVQVSQHYFAHPELLPKVFMSGT